MSNCWALTHLQFTTPEVDEDSDVGVSIYSQFQTASPGSDKGSSAQELWTQFINNGELKDPSLRPNWWLEVEAADIGTKRWTGKNGDATVERNEEERVVQAAGPPRRSHTKDAIAAALCQKVM